MKESEPQIIDMHLHKSGTLENPANAIKHLNENDVDVGFMIPNPMAPGKGLREEKATERIKKWVGGPNNNRAVRIVSSWTRPLSRGMFVKEPENQAVVDATKKYPNRLMAWIWENPSKKQQDVLDDAERFFENDKDNNIAGSKMHFGIFPTKITDSTIWEIADLTGKANKAILIDVGTNPGNMKGFDDFVKAHPSVPFVVAHFGSRLPEVMESVLRNKNTVFDMAGYPITPENTLKIIKKIPAEKIIFGSDATIGGSIKDSRKNLESWRLTPREKELILSGNIVTIVPKAGELLKARRP